MAVFTPVTRSELSQFLSAYALDSVIDFRGIDAGIENSNFFVSTEQHQLVLTLFERLSMEQLPFYLNLMHHLAAAGVPCPDPVAARNGSILQSLHGKPAALVTRLPGEACMQPGPEHCASVGHALARMHLAAAKFSERQPNLRGLGWWREVIPDLLPQLPVQSRSLLEEELSVQATFAASAAYRQLPTSAVHADLFRDNILFMDAPTGPTVSGIIDFYFAGQDTWVFDLAVTVNDWCTHDNDCRFDQLRLEALLAAYQKIRPITRPEQNAWPYALRAAALRFWVSRLHDAFAPRPAERVTPKSPEQFEQMLLARRQDAVSAGQALHPMPSNQ
ncbi:MAG: homoserine kinase [Burkholderiaceae bacterium]